jgi:phage shock protein A
MNTFFSIIATAFIAFVAVGFLLPRSIPGLFVWTVLDRIGLAGAGYRERNALAVASGALRRRKQNLAPKVDQTSQAKAELASLERQRKVTAQEIEVLNHKIKTANDQDAAPLASKAIAFSEQLVTIDRSIATVKSAIQKAEQALKSEVRNITATEQKTASLAAQYNASRVAESVVKLNFDQNDDTDEALDLLQRQIDKNLSRVELSEQINPSDSIPEQSVADYINSIKGKP